MFNVTINVTAYYDLNFLGGIKKEFGQILVELTQETFLIRFYHYYEDRN